MTSICESVGRFFFGQLREADVQEKDTERAWYHDPTNEEVANKVISVLLQVKSSRQIKKTDLLDIVDGQGWSEDIAKSILEQLSKILKDGADLSEELKRISDAAEECTHMFFEFVEKHPEAATIFFTLVAIGVLSLLMPWVLETLGFTLEGPLADSFAAWWQSRYLGYVPRNSWFSFFQQLAMKH
ncbi:hypothetical protein BKA67DRAFT_662993 [Truncatella angustata]|uniref:Uncharacterized protein n=1 Tax=Truncatella angustata TaxID=152316 RepID=A0A9P8RNR1_9PEZI|nr:uncharacterized protein BKA67DRAFT_662993 [Truncatella angustata]KAH6646585.1 hypothetical protein BKA67DRAFT_662993 [Truncatella angustata]KAH8195080.1 hypothetical protein TruAng_010756 [Truncatella angustata]